MIPGNVFKLLRLLGAGFVAVVYIGGVDPLTAEQALRLIVFFHATTGLYIMLGWAGVLVSGEESKHEQAKHE